MGKNPRDIFGHYLQAVKLNLQTHPELQVLHEALVSAFGLPPGREFVSIRGDPSLRETAPIRARYASGLDKFSYAALDACEILLVETGVYAIYIGFNSGEVRTESVFNPFAYEIHEVERLIQPTYRNQHFVHLPFIEKMRAISWIRAMVQTGPLRSYLPGYWQELMDEQRQLWHPPCPTQVGAIVQAFHQLRNIEGYYLRNAAISLSQGIVRASFNCDGTYVIYADAFVDFVRQNTP